MQDWIFMANNFIIVFWLLSNYEMPEEKLYSKLLTLDKQQLYIWRGISFSLVSTVCYYLISFIRYLLINSP